MEKVWIESTECLEKYERTGDSIEVTRILFGLSRFLQLAGYARPIRRKSVLKKRENDQR